jgi:hypothetical protein
VGRTSTAVEAHAEEERAHDMNPTAVGKDLAAISVAVVWARRWWRWRGVEVHAEEERARGVNPTAVGEVIGDSSAWPRWLWRRSRSGRARGWQQNDTDRARV